MESGQDDGQGAAAWQSAMDWVMQQHEQPLDAAGTARLQAWLAASDLHRQAYAKAQQVWRLTGPNPLDA